MKSALEILSNHLFYTVEELQERLKSNVVLERTLRAMEEYATQGEFTELKVMAMPHPLFYECGWIPVEQRLPEEGGDYLVITHNTGNNIGPERFIEIDVWFGEWDNEGSEVGYHHTHWQPLPPKPEEIGINEVLKIREQLNNTVENIPPDILMKEE